LVIVFESGRLEERARHGSVTRWNIQTEVVTRGGACTWLRFAGFCISGAELASTTNTQKVFHFNSKQTSHAAKSVYKNLAS